MAFETIFPNTLACPNPVCRNFITYEDKVRETLETEDRTGLFKRDEEVCRDFDMVVSFKTQIRDGMATVGLDDVSLLPVALDAETKKQSYIYKVTDWADLKKTPFFGTKEKIISDLSRRVKGRRVIINYMGVNERCDFSPEKLSKLFDDAEPETRDVNITPIGRGDSENPIISVTIFKNCL